jgi:hypothetical protein
MEKLEDFMTLTLNRDAFAHAKHLVRQGRVVRDDRDDWSEHAPSTDAENRFIERNDFGVYAEWHLGEDTAEPNDTKKRYSFPYGDLQKVHRCAVVSLESRAAQHDHAEIARAAKQLLDLIDRPDNA